MNNTSKVALASGVVFGVGAIYAYQNNITFESVVNKLSQHQEKFNDFIQVLIEIAIETLQKLFDWVVELVREIVFKIKLALN